MADKDRYKPYKRKEWEKVRAEVLRLDHYECQRCAGNYMADPTMPKRHTRATLVHHHFHLVDYPQWKYKIWVTVDGKRVRNLVSLCNDCHEYIHRDTHRSNSQKKKEDEFTTPERWD